MLLLLLLLLALVVRVVLMDYDGHCRFLASTDIKQSFALTLASCLALFGGCGSRCFGLRAWAQAVHCTACIE